MDQVRCPDCWEVLSGEEMKLGICSQCGCIVPTRLLPQGGWAREMEFPHKSELEDVQRERRD